jgi:hypothetical protein
LTLNYLLEEAEGAKKVERMTKGEACFPGEVAE